MKRTTLTLALILTISSSVMAKTEKPTGCKGVWLKCVITKLISCGKGPCKVPVFVPPVVKGVKR